MSKPVWNSARMYSVSNSSRCGALKLGGMMYVEFVFHLTQVFQSPRLHPLYRPSGGFLAPEHWKAALEAAGFLDIRFMPDVVRIHDKIPDFGVAAIGATRPG
jgi:hypothetical protein